MTESPQDPFDQTPTLVRALDDLGRRLTTVESRLAALEGATPVALPLPPSPPQPAYPQAPPPPLPPYPQGPYPQGPFPGPVSGPGHRPLPPAVSSETLLKWAGVVLVVLAALFGVGTAISRGWIGPWGQLALAVAGGVALVAVGLRLDPRSRPWGRALVVGGGLVLELSAAGAEAGLHLVAPEVAIVGLGLVAAGLAAVAAWRSMPAVATTTVAAALLLPFWVVAGDGASLFVVGGVVTAVAVGFTAIGVVRTWTVCRLVAALLGAFSLAVLVAGSDLDNWPSAEGVAALAAVLAVGTAAWLAPVAADRLAPERRTWLRGLDHRLILHLPLWLWLMVTVIGGIDGHRPVALAGGLTAAGFAALAVVGWRWLPRSLTTAHLLAAGVVASLAVAVATQGPVLLVVVAVQAAAVAVLARWFDRHEARAGLLLWVQAAGLGVIAVVWAAVAILGAWFETTTLAWHGATLLVAALVTAAAVVVWRAGRPGHEGQGRALALVAWGLGLAWLAAVLVHGTQGQASVSAVWAALAAAALMLGVRYDEGLVRVTALVTLGLVLAKLLTVDLAAVDTFWRVGLFFVIGIGLLRLGYVLPRLARRTGGATGAPPPR